MGVLTVMARKLPWLLILSAILLLSSGTSAQEKSFWEAMAASKVLFSMSICLLKLLFLLEEALATSKAGSSDMEALLAFKRGLDNPGGLADWNNNSSPYGKPKWDNTYSGYAGAFRCLVEGMGDIAFIKADTVRLYSLEGMNNQSWSTKSVSDFMYLCPQGGCRPINDYPGDCKFGSVPANTIMARNSLPNSKRLAIVQTLLNASWTDALYSGKNWADHVLTAGTQGLTEVKQLTRSYLGASAFVSRTIEDLNSIKVENPYVTNSPLQASSATSTLGQHLWTIAGLLSLYGLL